MQGFKNLLPRQLLSDDSVQPVVKKSDQHRKTTQILLQHFFSIYKNLQQFSTSFESQIFQLHHQLTQTESRLPLYFLQLTQLFKNINIELKIFQEKSNGSYKQLNSVCNSLFLEYSNVVLNFQQHIRNYQALEQIVFEMSKKYWRTFKGMVGSLDSYKSSFTDARLIYNVEEKVKRYQLCETSYKAVVQEFKGIQEKCQKLTEKKVAIRDNFIAIQNQMKKTIKVISTKAITQVKNFVKNYGQFQKTIVTFLAQKKFSLQKLPIATFFESISNTKCLQYFNCQINPAQCVTVPALFVYIDNLKSEYIPYCKTAFLNYFKEASQKVEKRKEINRQIVEFLKVYTQAVEKYQYTGLKEIVGNFQKLKKKLSQLYSARFVSFLKSIHSIFELAIGINQKLLKTFNSKVKNIQVYVNQENKHMEMFMKQLKGNIEKFTGRKDTSNIPSRKSIPAGNEPSMLQSGFREDLPSLKSVEMNKSTIVMEESYVVVDNTELRTELKERGQFLAHLIHGFVSKLEANQKQLKASVSSMVHDYSESTNEFYSLCCEYEAIYFGQEEFVTNFKKYEGDIDKTLEKETAFMTAELGFKNLVEEEQESRNVVFDGDIAKIDDFKKLKKPQGMETSGTLERKPSMSVQTEKEKMSRKQSSGSADIPNQPQTGSRTPPNTSTNPSTLKQSLTLSNTSQLSKQPLPNGINSSGDNTTKYFQLLQKKIKFQQGQQYIKSYSCAFYDKIILQGRILITNRRLCFHSKFNPTTIFFGGTFIEIPKKDITKVEKRYNALIFDNSIAITTVNGEMFFTSFFSRDEAYEIINRTLELNVEEQFFEAEEEVVQDGGDEENAKSLQLIEQDDDLKPEDEKARQEEVGKLLESFPYQTLLQSEIQTPNITAIKFFRLFDSGQQIHHNRRTHKSFLQYCKQIIGHKQIQIHHFKPNILQFLNISNIKSTTPIKIQRKCNAMVPISAAGVPFMPKAARSDQIQALYFISKNKYVIESTIQNSGAPYTDCFNVKLKRTVETGEENKVKFKAEMYVNFVKSTMMKGMIESKAVEETKAYFVKMTEEAKKYFKNLEKARKPEVQHKGAPNQVNQASNQQLQQLRKQLDTSLQQKQQLEQKVTTLSAKQSKFKQYLFISVILNIFLVLLLFN